MHITQMIKNIQLFPFGIYGRIQNLTESYTGAVSISPTSFSTGKPQLSTLVFSAHSTFQTLSYLVDFQLSLPEPNTLLSRSSSPLRVSLSKTSVQSADPKRPFPPCLSLLLWLYFPKSIHQGLVYLSEFICLLPDLQNISFMRAFLHCFFDSTWNEAGPAQ